MPYEERLKRLELWTLEERRNRNDLVEVYKILNNLTSSPARIYQDLPGSIHEDIVMDGHRQGKKAYAYKYPLTFLK